MTAKLTSIAGRVMLSLLLAVIVGALAVLTVVPRAVGGAALTVLTGSMTPQIAVGSVVVVRPVDPRTLQVGDVITYQEAPGESTYVTHRILEIHDDTDPVTLTTKGDANRGADLDPVPVSAVRGKVLFDVPYLGTLKNAISSGGAGLLALLLGLTGYAVVQLAGFARERRADDATVTLPVPEPAGSTRATLALQLLVVTLRRSEFEGLPAQLVARSLRMDLLDEGTDEFTVALTREPDQLDELVHLLASFDPVRVERSRVMRVPVCSEESGVDEGHVDVAA